MYPQGFERAQAQYDAMEPPEPLPCRCENKCECEPEELLASGDCRCADGCVCEPVEPDEPDYEDY